jgi:hypothetical protein
MNSNNYKYLVIKYERTSPREMEYSTEGITVRHNDDTSLVALEKLNTLLITVHTETKLSTSTTSKH